ncbi:MAG TPA: alpha/beta hydrolase [Aquabacterium sp.]|uniref:alpha/beta fold hydrolase n=1 Tax=Aquabacterium sp. TaxID=1872578 RepID=UPI002E3607AF|nr:alpha/beta hydrolase [Aquabacterium sp.]HEX5371759.1 alpha/beta hydrolase [Aquabacterium sp.]
MNQANNAVSSSGEPQLCFVTCPGASTRDAATHRMAYWSWGDPANPRTLVCVHGLSRQGRDFDTLARALSQTYHVVCPDVVGRGHSDWLADPKGYQVFTYASDMVMLMQSLRAAKGVEGPLEIDWVGTSMGGLIGLGLSSLPPEASGARLRRMVLNDVGPKLRHEALVRIGEYLGQPKRFANEQEAADYLWSISTGFGPHTPAQWLALSRPLLRPAPDGQGLILHYDPAIAEPFKAISADAAASGEAMVWQVYDQLQCEVLLLRGQDSDLLDADTARQMSERGPKARLIEFPGVGHAPTLMAADQVAAVEGFLLA